MVDAGSRRSFFFLLTSIRIYVCVLCTIGAWNSTAAMRIVVQRVKSASVTVDGSIVSSIGPGAM